MRFFCWSALPSHAASSFADSRDALLGTIANPDAAFVLLLVGIYALLLEFAHPGTFLPGIVGVVCLTLAAFALSALPVQYGALALLIAGIALMTAEAFTPGFGLLGLLGFIAFVSGGYFLFDAPAGQIEMRVSMPLSDRIVGCERRSDLFRGRRRHPGAQAADRNRRRAVAVGTWHGHRLVRRQRQYPHPWRGLGRARRASADAGRHRAGRRAATASC